PGTVRINNRHAYSRGALNQWLRPIRHAPLVQLVTDMPAIHRNVPDSHDDSHITSQTQLFARDQPIDDARIDTVVAAVDCLSNGAKMIYIRQRIQLLFDRPDVCGRTARAHGRLQQTRVGHAVNSQSRTDAPIRETSGCLQQSSARESFAISRLRVAQIRTTFVRRAGCDLARISKLATLHSHLGEEGRLTLPRV